MSNLSDNKDWEELLKLLEKGVKSGKFIIPYSLEHLLETSHKNLTNAQNTDKLLYNLSNGRVLEPEHIANANLLLCFVRRRTITNSSYTNIVKQNLLADDQNYLFYKNLKEKYDNMIMEATILSNQIREITRAKKQKSDFSTLAQSVIYKNNIYQNDLISRLFAFYQNGKFKAKIIQFEEITIPYWADTLTNYLIYELKMTRKEAKSAHALIKKFGIKKIIPPIYIRAALETILSIKQQKETPNDHIDINRLCVALPYSDIIMTDKSKVFDIKTLKLDIDFKTEVFSGNKEELSKFMEKIRSLLN